MAGTSKGNEASKQRAIIRVENAYNYWLGNKEKGMKKAASMFKTDYMKLRNHIEKNGHNLLSCNPETFSSINTEEKAYWLGFLYADGSVGLKNNDVELALQDSDNNHLEKFKTFIGSSNNIKIDSYRCRLVVCNTIFKENLVKWGCTAQKSLKIKFPGIDKELVRHFIRGYFDGDGCISRACSDCLWHTASIACGSEAFINSLSVIIEEFCNVKTTVYRKSKGSNTFIICFDGKRFTKFINWIYKDCKIFLDRKYQRYLDSVAVVLSD